jgi:hypothetical protein
MRGILQMEYKKLNVLSQKEVDFTSPDAIDKVASMLKASKANRSQRRRLEKSLGKMETILAHSQKYVDKSAFKQYQAAADENMRRFFAVLGIVMKNRYNWNEENGEISDLFDIINTYLEEYQNVPTDDVARICEEVTDIQLISE